jgi:hypothetical protein
VQRYANTFCSDGGNGYGEARRILFGSRFEGQGWWFDVGALKEEILLVLHQAEALSCLGISCSIVVRLFEDVLMV